MKPTNDLVPQSVPATRVILTNHSDRTVPTSRAGGIRTPDLLTPRQNQKGDGESESAGAIENAASEVDASRVGASESGDLGPAVPQTDAPYDPDNEPYVDLRYLSSGYMSPAHLPPPAPTRYGDARRQTYFIHAPEVNRVKIGKAYSIADRFANLSCSSPCKLHLAAYLQGDREFEMHNRFMHARLHGEWFAALPSLVAYIKSLNRDCPIEAEDFDEAPLLEEFAAAKRSELIVRRAMVKVRQREKARKRAKEIKAAKRTPRIAAESRQA